MTFYKCQRCGYNTNHKNNFRKHLNRKFPCEPILKEISISQVKAHYKMLEVNKLTNLSSFYPHNILNLSSQNEDKKYKCKYCNKILSTYKNCWRHETKYCKEKKKTSDNKMLLIKIEQMKNEISKMKSQITINNSNNSNNNNNNNIQILNFGKEDIDYISEKKIKKLLLSPATAIPNLLKQIHFHPKHPENHNVKLTNLHDKYAKIFKNKSWETINKEDLLFILVVVGKFIYEDMKDEKKLDEYLLRKYDQLEKLHDKKLNKIYDTVKIMLFDETKKLSK